MVEKIGSDFQCTSGGWVEGGCSQLKIHACIAKGDMESTEDIDIDGNLDLYYLESHNMQPLS